LIAGAELVIVVGDTIASFTIIGRADSTSRRPRWFSRDVIF
jgi:hypothetical protein